MLSKFLGFVFVAATTGTIVWAVRKKKLADSINMNFINVKYKGIKSGSLNLELVYDIENPTTVDATLNSLNLTISTTSGMQLAKINQTGINTLIKPESNTRITLPMKSNLVQAGVGILSTITSYFKDKTAKQSVTLKGTSRIDSILFNIDESISLVNEG